MTGSATRPPKGKADGTSRKSGEARRDGAAAAPVIDLTTDDAGDERSYDDDRPRHAPEVLARTLLDARERADRAVGLDRAADLLDARRRALGEADERLREIDERAVLAELAEAGRGLLQSLDSLTRDTGFWAELRAAEGALDHAPRADLLRLREVVDHDLLEVLPEWGFRPPPSEVEFAGSIQLALGDLFGMRRGDPFAARRIDRAKRELDWFRLRLRRVLDESEAVARAPRIKGSQETASARVRGVAWVRRAAQAAGPAAVAAGAVTAVGGPGLAAVAAAAGTETLKQLVQVTAADAMGQVMGAGGLPEPDGLAEDLEKTVGRAMRRLADVSNLEPGEPAREAAVFVVRRELYRVLQYESGREDVGRLQDYCEKALHLLRDPDLALVRDFWDTGRLPGGHRF